MAVSERDKAIVLLSVMEGLTYMQGEHGDSNADESDSVAALCLMMYATGLAAGRGESVSRTDELGGAAMALVDQLTSV